MNCNVMDVLGGSRFKSVYPAQASQSSAKRSGPPAGLSHTKLLLPPVGSGSLPVSHPGCKNLDSEEHMPIPHVQLFLQFMNDKKKLTGVSESLAIEASQIHDLFPPGSFV